MVKENRLVRGICLGLRGELVRASTRCQLKEEEKTREKVVPVSLLPVSLSDFDFLMVECDIIAEATVRRG